MSGIFKATPPSRISQMVQISVIVKISKPRILRFTKAGTINLTKWIQKLYEY